MVETGIRDLHEALQRGGVGEVGKKVAAGGGGFLRDAFFGGLRLMGLPDFLKDVERLEAEIPAKGIGPVAREFLNNLGIEVVAGNTPEWVKKPGSPALFYGNHDNFLEPFLLAGLCDRDDLAFIGNEFSRRVGPNASKHVLPVLASRYAVDSGEKLTRREEIFVGQRVLTRAQIAQMNEASLSKATERLASGWAVGIFPSPGVDVAYPWFSGIGKIVQGLPEGAKSQVALSPIKFGHVKVTDLLRAVRARYKQGKAPRPSQVPVDFGALRSVADLGLSDLSAHAVTQRLQADYLAQFSVK